MCRFEGQMPSAKALKNKRNHIFQVLFSFVTVCRLSPFSKMLFVVIIMSLNANVIHHDMLSFTPLACKLLISVSAWGIQLIDQLFTSANLPKRNATHFQSPFIISQLLFFKDLCCQFVHTPPLTIVMSLTNQETSGVQTSARIFTYHSLQFIQLCLRISILVKNLHKISRLNLHFFRAWEYMIALSLLSNFSLEKTQSKLYCCQQND